MDRPTALVFGDTVQQTLNHAPDVINVFDPRMSAAAIDRLVQRIRANPVLQHTFRTLDIDDAVQQVLAERREVAASPAICTRLTPSAGSRPYVYARHCRSGLRVRMTLDTDTAIITYVQAKASEVPEPICPSGHQCERTGPDPTFPIALRYGGLGIGTSVYAAAAAVAGHHIGRPVRVIGRPSTPYSHAVRWKLHCADPYFWQYHQCATCGRAGIDWASASSSVEFPPHERFGPDEPSYIP